MRRLVFLLALSLVAAGCSAPDAGDSPAGEDDAAEPDSAPSPGTGSVAEPVERLDAPSLLSPSDGQRRVDPRDVTLTWRRPSHEGAGTVSTTVFLNGAARCADETGATRCRLGALDPGRTYSWKVVARTSSGLVEESATWTFRTNAPPTTAIALLPAPGSRNTLQDATFSFQPGDDPDGDAVTTTLTLRDLDRGGTESVRCGGATSCRATLRLATSYQYRLDASDGMLTTSGEWVAFRTNAPPTAPRPDPGDDGAEQVPMEFAYGFQGSTDPDGEPVTYTVRLDPAPAGGARPCVNVPAPACEVAGLRAGTTYRMTLTARDPNGLEASSSFRFTTRLPIVFLHGWNSNGDSWVDMTNRLLAHGYDYVNFGSAAQPTLLSYRPTSESETIPEIAAGKVAPAIERALVAAGYGKNQRVDVVAHSMGGLVSRVLVEKAGSSGSGWSVPSKWATQIRSVIMFGTPNHGSGSSGPFACAWGDNNEYGEDVWYGSCRQMEEGSSFLTQFLGDAPRVSARYLTVGGTDDWVVDVDSPRLEGVEHLVIEGACHTYTGCGETSLQYHVESEDIILWFLQ